MIAGMSAIFTAIIVGRSSAIVTTTCGGGGGVAHGRPWPSLGTKRTVVRVRGPWAGNQLTAIVLASSSREASRRNRRFFGLMGSSLGIGSGEAPNVTIS
jgi:hypothetical protein